MRRRRGFMTGGMLAALVICGCTSAGAGRLGPPKLSEDLLRGGQYIQPWLDAALQEAETHPLGSDQHPVRADMPAGQHAYLSRLRCNNDVPPTWRRVGNLGAGVFGSIVDQYDVRCVGAHPPRTLIVMDMYFPGHAEARAVEGFRIVPP